MKNSQFGANDVQTQLHNVLDSLDDAFFILDNEFRVILLNRKAEEFLGRGKETVFDVPISELFAPELIADLSSLLEQGRGAGSGHLDLVLADKRRIRMKVKAFPDMFLLTLTCDIYEERLEIEQNERRLRFMLDSLPHIAYIATREGRDTYLNHRWVEYSGKPLEEGLGMKWQDIVYPEDLNDFMHSWKIGSSKGEPFNSQYRLRNAAGEYRWHLAYIVPLKDETGKVVFWMGTGTDIHEQKLIEEELKASKHFITKVTEASPDLICVYNLRLEKFTYVNSQINFYLGYSAEELVNFTSIQIQQRIHPSDRARYHDYHRDFLSATDDEIREIEYRARNDKGEWRWLRGRGKVFQRDEKGEVEAIVAITQEVTAKKEAEEKERQNEFLKDLIEKKEEFMSIASHELKTPITTMKASLQILGRLIDQHEDEKVLLVYIKKANQQINKLVGLISQLMDNARIQAGKLDLKVCSFNFQEVIDDCIAHIPDSRLIVDNQLKEPVEADKNRIEQVLMNFLTNAIKYSPKANKIILKVMPLGTFVKVSVKDFGIGIPKNKLDSVFDRFFRVDDHSKDYSGLGLGLFIAAEIIQRHNGEYGVESEEGEGSTFWFKIPIRREIEKSS